MKFKSVRRNGNRRFVGNAPFDVKYVKDIAVIDEDFIVFYYDLYDFQAGFSKDVTQAYFSAEITSDNLFLQSTIYYAGDDTAAFMNYLSEWGDLECEVEMSELESKKLLLLLLGKTLQCKIKKVSTT